MKTDELRDSTIDELTVKEEDLKVEIFNLRVQFATGKLENPMKLRELRRGIARVKTILREKKVGEVSDSEN